MISGTDLKIKVTDLLAEEIGLLSDVVVDEILAALGIEEQNLSSFWAGKFVQQLDQRLPEDINQRQALLRNVADVLISAK